MSRYLLTPEASQDLDEIAEYIAQKSPAAATRTIDDLERRCEFLAKFPGTGRSREDLAPGLRSFAVGKYLIVFRPIGNGVEIVRVVHGSRDLPSLYYP